MKLGDKVKVIAWGAFTGRTGTVRKFRKGLLPIGVRGLQSRVSPEVWFDESELEIVE